MLDSLFGSDVQAVLDASKAGAAFPSPPDWRDQVIYFLMVDRFNGSLLTAPRQKFDGDFGGFQGGSYRGIQAQLPYLKNLGVGAIWLSPVLKNFPFRDTYHGYGIHDFIRAEPRFADKPANADDELRELVDAAHALGIYIIFDIVLNHTGDAFEYDGFGDQAPHQDPNSQALPVHWRDASGTPKFASLEGIAAPPAGALVWPKELQQDRYYRRHGVTGAGDDVIGDFDSLKQFQSADTGFENAIIRSYQYVIARFDCDGFRIDTLRYLQPPLPATFGNSMREFGLSIGKKNFFTFGEVFDANAEADIAKFIGRNTRDRDDTVGVDAAVDYPLFNHLKSVLKGFAPPQSLVDMYQERKNVEQFVVSSHGEATRFFVTFLDNHDNKERFYRVDAANPPGTLDHQLTAAVACLFSLQGIPCLYYGTEQQLHGFDPEGRKDELCREALWGKPAPAFDQTNPFYVAIRKVAQVRAAQPALRYGRQYFRQVSGDGGTFGISTTAPGVVAFSRILNDAEVVVVINVAPTPIDLHVIVDATLQPAGTVFRVAFSNQAGFVQPDAVASHPGGHAIHVHLRGREAQILTR